MANKSIFDQLTIIIIAKNEELMLPKCLVTLKSFPHLLVVNNNSTDETAEIANKAGARVITTADRSFSQLRDLGAKKSTTDWIFYLDADERLTPRLASEIANCIKNDKFVTATCRRQNYFYGHKFTAGGWDKDEVTRLFKRSALVGWQGEIHETPIYKGPGTFLDGTLWHLTHRNTGDNLIKTATWTKMEAGLLAKSSKTPKVTKAIILRKGFMEFYRRYFQNRGYLDGMAGFVESLVQGMNKMLIYIQVWEMQLKPSLTTRYDEIEERINQDWKKKGQKTKKST